MFPVTEGAGTRTQDLRLKRPLLDSVRPDRQSTYTPPAETFVTCLAILGQTDPQLERVAEAWPALPEHLRAAILALVETAPPQPTASNQPPARADRGTPDP